MSWNDRQYLTELEARDRRELPHSQFAAGDVVIMSLAELEEDFNSAPTVEGCVVGVSFTASQVRYDLAFPIKNSEIYVVVKGVRAQMFRPSDGAETNYIKMEEAEEMARNLKVELTVVGKNSAPEPDQSLADIVKELEQTLVNCNRYNYCHHVLAKLRLALNLPQ